jgi:hypothetical protein
MACKKIMVCHDFFVRNHDWMHKVEPNLAKIQVWQSLTKINQNIWVWPTLSKFSQNIQVYWSLSKFSQIK